MSVFCLFSVPLAYSWGDGLILPFLLSFYGFPGHYYKEKYPNVGSREIAQKVISAVQDAGLNAEGVKRGLDHGVWASFKCGMYGVILVSGEMG